MKSIVAVVIASCAHGKSSSPSPPPAEGVPTSRPIPMNSTIRQSCAGGAEACGGDVGAPVAVRSDGSQPIAQQWVDAHNRVRAKHCAKPLQWSPQIAAVAQKWANQLKAQGCAFDHSGNEAYGENLAGGTEGALDPESTVAMWYDEVKHYKFGSGGFSMNTGHFTQLVWTDTERVGCGQVSCNGNVIIVCNYDPPGNWDGQYRDHVLPTSCKK